PEISRITVIIDVDQRSLEQITKQLNKLVNVLKIVQLDPRQTVQRELILIKVSADNTSRTSVLEIVQMFRAKVVDAAADAVTIEAPAPRTSWPPCSACSRSSASARSSSPVRWPSAAAAGPSPTAACSPETRDAEPRTPRTSHH